MFDCLCSGRQNYSAFGFVILEGAELLSLWLRDSDRGQNYSAFGFVILEGAELLSLWLRDSDGGQNYSAFGFVILEGGALQIQSPVRYALFGLFPFCPYESKLSTAKMKKAH